MYSNNTSNSTSKLVTASKQNTCPQHLTEWVEGSAVNEAIGNLNIESVTAAELNERIQPKDTIKTGGWWCRGVNWPTGVKMGNRYGQGKPDKPHQPKRSEERRVGKEC